MQEFINFVIESLKSYRKLLTCELDEGCSNNKVRPEQELVVK